ncbi:plastocyanin/azurin family copper-binding protein [Streptomyces sp. NPDC058293]|uniref:cupredoxin domain-containing protein n=1 Tax=Streptomyces sp. NPDC058293 TaxID=3346429 RepID=UPI0036E9112C
MHRLNALHAVRFLLAALLTTGSVTFLGTPPAQAASRQVVMSGYAFGPRSVTITAGDTVTWVNQDQAPHDVKTTSGPEPIHSPMLNKGGSWSHTFTGAGTYGYVCTVHPDMTAQLVVEPAAAPAPTSHPATHQHPSSAPAAARHTHSSDAATPSAHTHHSTKATPTTPARTSATETSTTSAAAAQPPTPVQGAASDTRPLDPLLLLAGVVAGIAVLCLLLVGSRSATATSRNGGTSTS